MAELARASWLKSVDYDPVAHTLTVETRTGKKYDYADVPESIYTGFVTADSAGSYFNTHIQGHYKAPEDQEERDIPWQFRV